MSSTGWRGIGAAIVVGILSTGFAAEAEEPGQPTEPPAPDVSAPVVVEPVVTPVVDTKDDQPAAKLVGPYDDYRPLATYDFKGFRIQIPLMLSGRAEGVTAFPVDRYGGTYHAGAALSPLVRLGARFETLKLLAGKFLLLAEYEHDLPTGTWTSNTPIAGVYNPNSQDITTELRKGYGRFSVGRYFHAGAGFMTSHWGMGLLANDGAHGWEPGSGRFTDQRGGARVLRGFLGTGPLTRAAIIANIAVDQVRGDDTLLQGDSAVQFIASALAGYGKPTSGGFFIVHRRQKSADGHELNVTAVDLAGKSILTFSKATLTLEAEAVVIAGNTTLAPNADFSRHDVLQVGAAARANVSFGRGGGVLDLVYASGDQNYSDRRVTGFKADSNFEEGLLMFRYIEAAQTARGAITAADPTLVGAPQANLDRVPTRGGVTNAVVLFPRFWVRPTSGLEAYGGPLFAFAPVKNVDPLNTTLAGGVARNALNGDPGSYWGTEIDLGIRYRALLHGAELTVGAEGGVLFPGSAIRDVNGNQPDRVLGGRLMLTCRL